MVVVGQYATPLNFNNVLSRQVNRAPPKNCLDWSFFVFFFITLIMRYTGLFYKRFIAFQHLEFKRNKTIIFVCSSSVDSYSLRLFPTVKFVNIDRQKIYSIFLYEKFIRFVNIRKIVSIRSVLFNYQYIRFLWEL